MADTIMEAVERALQDAQYLSSPVKHHQYPPSTTTNHDDDATTLQEDSCNDETFSDTTLGGSNTLTATAGDTNRSMSLLGRGLSQLNAAAPTPPLTIGRLEAFNASVDHPIQRRLDGVARQTQIDTGIHFSDVSDDDIEPWAINDFINNQDSNVITVIARWSEYLELSTLAAKGAFRHNSSRRHLCGIYALVISLNAILSAPFLVAKGARPVTVKQLRELLASARFLTLWTQYAHLYEPWAREYRRTELQHRGNLAAEHLAVLLQIVGEGIGHPFQLGTCLLLPATEHGATRYQVDRLRAFDDGVDATTIWLVCEHRSGDDFHHWSGMAPDPGLSPTGHAVANHTPQRPRTSAGQCVRDNTSITRRRAISTASPASPTSPPTLVFRTVTQPPRLAPVNHASPPANAIYCAVEGCKRHHLAANLKPFANKKAHDDHHKTAHLPEHLRKHGCSIEGCPRRFHYPKDVTRHLSNIHYKDHPQWCLVPTCALSGPEHRTTEWNLRRHYKHVHVEDSKLWLICKETFRLKEQGQGSIASTATSPA